MSNITEQVNLFTSDKGYRNITIDAIQIVKPINWEENSELAKLLKQNYEKNMKLGKVSYNDKHFMVGEGAVPYYGFGDCSLPLILTIKQCKKFSFPYLLFAIFHLKRILPNHNLISPIDPILPYALLFLETGH